jgi:DNA-directed RNA polymerase specialized sigma24 family protein
VLARVADFDPDDAANFGRWLRAILHRVLLRKSDAPDVKRREALPDDVTAAAADITMNTRLSLSEIETLRERLLEGFAEEDRVIWRERQRGLAAAEIAARLGMTDRNVRLRYAKTEAAIRVRLRRAMGEDADELGDATRRSGDDAADDAELEAYVADYLLAREEGTAPPLSAFLARHAHVADRLALLLADLPEAPNDATVAEPRAVAAPSDSTLSKSYVTFRPPGVVPSTEARHRVSGSVSR